MSSKYPDTKPKFKVGDEVVTGEVHRWYGEVYQREVKPGQVWKVVEVDPDYGDNYDFKTHTYRLEQSLFLPAVTHVDEDCLTPNIQPVTEEELAEVYELLGVKEAE